VHLYLQFTEPHFRFRRSTLFFLPYRSLITNTISFRAQLFRRIRRKRCDRRQSVLSCPLQYRTSRTVHPHLHPLQPHPGRSFLTSGESFGVADLTSSSWSTNNRHKQPALRMDVASAVHPLTAPREFADSHPQSLPPLVKLSQQSVFLVRSSPGSFNGMYRLSASKATQCRAVPQSFPIPSLKSNKSIIHHGLYHLTSVHHLNQHNTKFISSAQRQISIPYLLLFWLRGGFGSLAKYSFLFEA